MPETLPTEHRLLLFTRYPESGVTKTRLIPVLGAAQAALVQKRLTERLVRETERLEVRTGIGTTIHFAGGSRALMTAWLGPRDFRPQAEGDLGDRMRAALTGAFAEDCQAAVLIGSDIPDLDARLLERAFTMLGRAKVVLGPSRDGGYYLIGLVADQADRLLPLLFGQMAWSTGQVLTETLARLAGVGQRVALLPTLQDIDRPEDLALARARGLL